MNIRKILVPVDYSKGSLRALELAADMASSWGAALDVVHVWDRPLYVSDGVMVRQAGGPTRSLVDMIRENAESEMLAFLAEAKHPRSVPLEQRLLSGNPASKILEELERREHDLVIIGTHGRTGLRHFLLGSVAEKVVRLSPVPVLTVPPAH